ncbi:MAG: hypothetical protein A2W27_10995 [Deltaproteobacteria bacterium RBG_16_44_11]|nr:MAG: hypothetical protein A2W27_10995 [Deltaproteobacteria bacterium RBG_16_44_11]
MASPQIENGHIDIAHEIAGALMKTNLSAYQSRILWALWRKTYGWHKTEDWISNSQFVEMTGIAKSHVSRAVKELSLRNMVTNSGNKIAFNKDYTQWRELPHGVRAYQVVTNSGNSITNSGNTVTPSGNKVTNSGVHKRNYTKETIQKKALQKKISSSLSKDFLVFYEAYPRKVGKIAALKAWNKLNGNRPAIEEILKAIEQQKQSTQWIKDGGQFIPHPATWINQGRWEDEGIEKHPLSGIVSDINIKNLTTDIWKLPS